MHLFRITLFTVTLAACAAPDASPPPGQLYGRLIDALGRPAAGWQVQIGDAARAATDGDGRFRVAPLAPGAYALTAEAPRDRGALTLAVAVPAGVRDLGDLVLPAGLRVHVAADGLPAGTQFEVLVDGSPAASVTAPSETAFTALTPGEHVVRVEAPGFAPFVRRLELRSAEITRVDAALRASEVRALVPDVAAFDERVLVQGEGFGFFAVDGQVFVGGVPARVEYWLDDEIAVRVPGGVEPGAGELRVVLGTHEFALTFGVRPTLVAAAVAADGRLEITGVNLGTSPGALALSGEAAAAPVPEAWSAVRVTAPIDAQLPPGAYTVSLTNGIAARETPAFTLAPSPAAPLALAVTAGTNVVLLGAHFGAAGTAAVGGVDVSLSAWGAGRIEFQLGATTPPGEQPVVIWVAGTGVPAGTLMVSPWLASAAPVVVQPGAELTLQGANFGGTAGAVAVAGAAATVVAWEAREIRVVVPADAPGGVTQVTVAAGGRYSNAVTVEVLPALAAPSGLFATPGTVPVVALRWADNSADETGFEVERKAGAGAYTQLAIVPAGVTAATDTAVAAGITYRYRVRALRAAVTSLFSAQAVVDVPLVWSVWGGFEHGCGSSWGELRCWGANGYAQLGGAVTSPGGVSSPTALAFAAPVSDGFAGSNHGCTVTTDGRLYCWGRNNAGQIGNGTASAVNVAAPWLTGLSRVKAGSAGDLHTCVLDAGGEVYCWGGNAYGQVGNGVASAVNVLVPTRVAGVGGAAELAARFQHTCVVRAGKVLCWGNNGRAQVGSGSATPASVTWPTQALGIDAAVGVAPGLNHTCAVLGDGGVRCWGRNNAGQIGAMLVGIVGPVTYPTAVSAPLRYNDSAGAWEPEYAGTLTGAVALASGLLHTCALTAWGRVYCWGQNDTGSQQLGLANTPHSCWGIACANAPVAVGLPGPAVRIRAGTSHTCAQLVDGRAYCWGRNASGQVGDGTTTTKAGAWSLDW